MVDHRRHRDKSVRDDVRRPEATTDDVREYCKEIAW